jgi:Protein of unknown function (DUF1266)
MKKVTNLLMMLAVGASLLFTSCGSKKTNEGSEKVSEGSEKLTDTELSGFMLGGIYFIHGWGGNEEVTNIVKQNAGDDKAKIITEYREFLIYPFKSEAGESAKQTLSAAWEVNSKEDLEKNLKELQNDPASKHKAWDYARLVNNVCLGYAAGYITKLEGSKYISETLPLAKAAYKTWDEYYADYNAGRKEWDAEAEDGKTFEKLSNEITKGEFSIYPILPLN